MHLSANVVKTKIVPFTRKKEGLKELSSLGTNTAAVHRSHIPWNYIGQGIDMENTAGQTNREGLQSLFDL
jgi:hypothetical protein